jgi:hypothetical protein
MNQANHHWQQLDMTTMPRDSAFPLVRVKAVAGASPGNRGDAGYALA